MSSSSPSSAPLTRAWLGRVPYREAHRLQLARRRGVLAGHAPDTLWLLEHSRVVTLGRRGGLDAPLAGIDVVRTERGGLATWHGPGQLVGYLIADVGRLGHGVKSTVAALERGLVLWLAGQGIAAQARAGFPGVWIGERKVASLGLHFRRGVSMHGFALNLCPDLSEFEAFTPCGIDGVEMTSVARERGGAPSPAEAWSSVGEAVAAALAGIPDPPKSA
ncbi:MAG: lipoyl(octanoyl) transferase [Deltaproteobacteria bacterium]|nr:MAG: lipoyl(octanoyl) transferase [Deltaproteobacteria bacterium]